MTIERMTWWLALVGSVGSGLIAGTFFAFSAFVMGALARLPAPQGIAAMQSINVVVINPVFMAAFMGTALLGIALAALGGLRLSTPGAGLMILGGLSYALGTFGVTMMANVPLNDRLAAVDPASSAGAALWATYLRDWTMWNTVRTIAAALAMVALMFGWRGLPR